MLDAFCTNVCDDVIPRCVRVRESSTASGCQLVIDANDAQFVVKTDVGYELICNGMHDDLQNW